jgi:SNF2 family DNA or RNA helicase
VAVKLPPRRAAIYHVELSADEQAYYDELSAFVADEVRAHALETPRDGRPMAVVLALINLQRELCSSPRSVARGLRRMGRSDLLPLDLGERMVAYAERADALPRWRKAEALEEVLGQVPGKAVVFCEFRGTLEALGERLAAAGIESVPFHGGLSQEERAAAIGEFRARARVLLATRAGAEGLNIQFCSTVVNFDLPWNPMIVEQRIGRVHRLGQQHSVTVVNLSVAGTIEARILELLAFKLQLFTAVLGEVDLILGALHSERGFEDLLREVWLSGLRTGALDQELDRFGQRLEEARREYARIKEAETILDTLAPPGTSAAEGTP